jgi:hypothetical protein
VSVGPEIILGRTRLFSKATRVLVTAMEKAKVKRLICVTGFGAGDSRGRGGLLYNAAFCLLLGRSYDDKDVQERIVRNTRAVSRLWCYCNTLEIFKLRHIAGRIA